MTLFIWTCAVAAAFVGLLFGLASVLGFVWCFDHGKYGISRMLACLVPITGPHLTSTRSSFFLDCENDPVPVWPIALIFYAAVALVPLVAESKQRLRRHFKNHDYESPNPESFTHDK